MYTDWKFGEFFLLLSQFFERIAHYSVTANLIFMLLEKPFEWKNTNALAAPFLLNGFCFISSMAGGILSDTCFRKTTTVIIGYIFYIAYVGFPFVFWSENMQHICNINNHTISQSIISENCSNIILPAIIFSAIGSGLIRSVVASMGADMANKRWENPSIFFNLYYWCLNAGSLTAFLVFSLIQQNFSRRWGYLTPCIILGLSFISFLSGGPYYIHNKRPSKSTIMLVFKIYSEACKKRISLFKQKPLVKSESQTNILHRRRKESIFTDESDIEHEYPDMFSSLPKENVVTKNNEYNSYSYPNISSINDQITSSSSMIETESCIRTDNVSFLDRCQIRFGGTFIEKEVQDVQRFSFVLVVLMFMIPYYLIYFQMESTYMYQGSNMRINILSGSSVNRQFNIPESWLIVLDIIFLMFLLPFLVKVIYPWLRAKKIYLRQTTKISLGFVFVAISVLIAGGIETRRLYVMYVLNETITQVVGNISHVAADMSVFYQVPQYLTMGFSESMAVVAGLELACTQVSGSMQGLTNGLFWFSSGLGSFVGTGTLYIFKQIHFQDYYNCHDNLNCHLNFYFFILAGIITVAFLFFILLLCKFRKLEKVERYEVLIRRVST